MKTELEKIIVVAEACGWRDCANRKNPLYFVEWRREQTNAKSDITQTEFWWCGFNPKTNLLDHIPDFATIDSIRSAVMQQSEEFQRQFDVHLGIIIYNERHATQKRVHFHQLTSSDWLNAFVEIIEQIKVK